MEHPKAIGLARHYVLLERGERAIDALKHASPEFAETWLWRANALHTLSRYEEAIESARLGLAIEPENPYLHYAIARAELMRSRFAEAEEAILESLRLHPDDPEGSRASRADPQRQGKTSGGLKGHQTGRGARAGAAKRPPRSSDGDPREG